MSWPVSPEKYTNANANSAMVHPGTRCLLRKPLEQADVPDVSANTGNGPAFLETKTREGGEWWLRPAEGAVSGIT